MKDVAEQSAVTVVHRITGNIHDVSIITDRVKKNVALRKCSRRVSGAAIVKKKGVPGYSAKTPVGE